MEIETISNPSLKSDVRFTVLQTRKNTIELELFRKNDLLRNLCIQELELTGVLPLELSTLNIDCNGLVDNDLFNVQFKKNGGISYQYPGSFLSKLSNQVENCSQTEIQIQVQSGIAKAAFSLAKDESLSKNSRKENMFIFENCQQKLFELHNDLNILRNTNGIDKDDQINKIDTAVSKDLECKNTELTRKRSNNSVGRDDVEICTVLKNTNSGSLRKETHHYGDRTKANLCQKEQIYLAGLPTETNVNVSKKTFGKNCTYVPKVEQKFMVIPSSSTLQTSTSSEIETYQLLLEQLHQPRSSLPNSDFVIPMHPNKTSRSTTLQRKSYAVLEPKTCSSNFLSVNKFGSLDRRKENRFHCYDYLKNRELLHTRRENDELLSQSNQSALESFKFSALDFTSTTSPALDLVPVHDSLIFNINEKKLQSKNREQLKILSRTQSLGNIASLVTEQKSISTNQNWNQTQKNQDISLHQDSQSIVGEATNADDSLTCNKEKLWCETCLDLRSDKSFFEIGNKNKKECSSRTTTRLVSFNEAPLLSPPSPPLEPLLPSSSSSSIKKDLALETPINCTVIESGKWLPYRETTKPFEMSDFYKYSTKFRSKQHDVTNKE